MVRRLSVHILFLSLLLLNYETIRAQHRPNAEVFSRWDLQKLMQPPKFRWEDDHSLIRSLLFEGEPLNGRKTEVFAYYSTPGILNGRSGFETDLPAIVLLHGGGGTAFSEWVQMWAERGYAAIAMDLGGKRPKAPEFSDETRRISQHYDFQREHRTRLKHAGPLDDLNNKILNNDGDLTNDWQFHAVAAAIRAHSLIGSFRETAPNKTALTGISWGGYLTCLTASLDARFKAAVPVYGCGFLYDGESVQRQAIERNTTAQQKEWIRWNDPSQFLPHCRVPIFFVNGTNDKHYPIRSYSRSYALVPGDKVIRIQAGMRHSHQAGWAPAEIARFIDQHVQDGAPLIRVMHTSMQERTFAAMVSEKQLPISAKLQYTVDHGPLVSRVWKTLEATIKDNLVFAEVPEAATMWNLAITDKLGGTITTDVETGTN